MKLEHLGWSPIFQESFAPYQAKGWFPARVSREHKHLYAVLGAEDELLAEVSGRFRHEAQSKSAFPAVGDWVAIEPRLDEKRATIHALLPRQGAFSRQAAGSVTDEQVVAANVTTVFLVAGLDGDFNPRRIERYLTLAWDSGASPVIVLNKADLCDDAEGRAESVGPVALGVPTHPVSAMTGEGIEALRSYLQPGHTVAFLGSSGVGKSTLVNALLGEARQQVREVREDDSRGRHTTTHRELIPIPGGAVLIDTPGMRELQLLPDAEGLERAFEDIEELAEQCRFGDCAHEGEPGCAVHEAIEEGRLDSARLESYLKLGREQLHAAARHDVKARLTEKAKGKKLAMLIRRHPKYK